MNLEQISPDEMDHAKRYLVLGFFEWEPSAGWRSDLLPVWRVVAFDHLHPYSFRMSKDNCVELVSDDADGAWFAETANPYADQLIEAREVYELPE